MTMDFELLVDDETVDPTTLANTMDRVGDELRSIEATFSVFHPDSWVSRLNRGEVSIGECPGEVAEVLDLCERFTILTAGAFDASLPGGGYDPTGIVKTWAMQRVIGLIAVLGAGRWLWGCSGDALVGGTDPRPWNVGVADPRVSRSTGRIVDRVAVGSKLSRLAIATSGVSERGAHIWGPAGGPPSSYLSATVIGPDLVSCDAWATALLAGGDVTADLAAAQGLEFMMLSERDGQLVAHRSAAWPRPSAAASSE